MSERIHALAQRLFGKATIEDCNLEEVKNLAQRFPYFAPAQFLLLEKLKQEGSEEYSSQLQKSILYYHNPLEFQYFIDSDRFYTAISFDGEKEEEETGIEPQTGFETEQAGEEEPGINEEVINFETELLSNEPEIIKAPVADAEYKAPVIEHPVSTAEQTESITEDRNEPDVEELPPPASQPPLKQEQLQPVSATRAEPVLSFEPYHTVDYFASQGIKLSQEDASKDKFGKQLKSFTEWLKTMKRLPATQIQGSVDTGSESKVQHLADDSVHQSDVWTEAMAEVWIKQGNTQKALETYNKLSLLNPSKKAYFATKIENLKRS
jgi:hypothetical protein